MASMATPCTTDHTNLAIEHGLVGAHDCVMLQRGEGVHERLEGALPFGGQFGFAVLQVDEAAEHHAIV